MITVSNEFKQAIQDGRVDFLRHATIALADGRTALSLNNAEIWNGGFNTDDSVSEDNAFTALGSAAIGSAKLTINNIYDEYSSYDFMDARVTLYIGLSLPSGKQEMVSIGDYFVNDAIYNGSTITLSLLSFMAKFDKPYSNSRLVYPASLYQIVRDACSICDIPLNTHNFPNASLIVNKRPEDDALTFREVISWVAQISGTYARCKNRTLQFRWFDTDTLERAYNASLDGGSFDQTSNTSYATGDVADGGTFNPWNVGYVFNSGGFNDIGDVHYFNAVYSHSISTDDVVVTGARISVKTKAADGTDSIINYERGQEGYVIAVEDNGFIDTSNGNAIAKYLGEKLIGIRFRKANVQHMIDPTIEAGDIGILIDRKGRSFPMLVTRTSLAFGSTQTTICGAETPAKNSAARFSEFTKNYVALRQQLIDEKTDREQALEDLSERLDEKNAMYTTIETDQQGAEVAWYLHDQPTLEESEYVWKMTTEAWGVSTDGGQTWNAGMTVDGDTIVRILQAVGINADWINTGTLTVGGRNNTYGDIRVLDISGNQIGQWNNDGINLAYGDIDLGIGSRFKLQFASNQYFLLERGNFTIHLGTDNGISPVYRSYTGSVVFPNNVNMYGFSFLYRNVYTHVTPGEIYMTNEGYYSIIFNLEEISLYNNLLNYDFSFITTNGRAHWRVSTLHIYGSAYLNDALIATVSSSSRRYKHDITADIDAGLDAHKLLDLPMKQFVFNTDHPLQYPDMEGKTIPGFIAEDVAEIYPAAVIHDKDGNVESWDERRIIPGMLALIQEQDKEIKSLEERVKKLEELISKLTEEE